MKKNPFFSFISILSTAVTITFVMVAYMVYNLNTSNLPPEVNRKNSWYADNAWAFRTKDNSNRNRGMSFKTASQIMENFPSAEVVSIHSTTRYNTCEAVGGEGSRARRMGRYVDSEWWIINNYRFISGKPITKDDYEAKLKIVVVSEQTARELFYSTDVVGRDVLIDFIPYTICGVVENVSPQFSVAFSDFWANLSGNQELVDFQSGSEGVNGFITFIAKAKPGKMKDLKAEMEESAENFNTSLLDTTFSMEVKTHSEFTFAKIMDINPIIIYVLLACILLIVPAVNISGLISSMLNKRFEEIGIRKVYGASTGTITSQFLTENLLLIIIGGVIGLILSFIILYVFRTWLLGVSVAHISQIEMSWNMFFRPSIFLMAFVFCLVFNLLSTFLPVWYVSGKNIINTLKK